MLGFGTDRPGPPGAPGPLGTCPCSAAFAFWSNNEKRCFSTSRRRRDRHGADEQRDLVGARDEAEDVEVQRERDPVRADRHRDPPREAAVGARRRRGPLHERDVAEARPVLRLQVHEQPDVVRDAVARVAAAGLGQFPRRHRSARGHGHFGLHARAGDPASRLNSGELASASGVAVTGCTHSLSFALSRRFGRRFVFLLLVRDGEPGNLGRRQVDRPRERLGASLLGARGAVGALRRRSRRVRLAAPAEQGRHREQRERRRDPGHPKVIVAGKESRPGGVLRHTSSSNPPLERWARAGARLLAELPPARDVPVRRCS